MRSQWRYRIKKGMIYRRLAGGSQPWFVMTPNGPCFSWEPVADEKEAWGCKDLEGSEKAAVIDLLQQLKPKPSRNMK